MALITLAEVKAEFLAWEEFCTLVLDPPMSADEVLQVSINMAIREFCEYLTVADGEETDKQKGYLIALTKYHAFGFKHDDTEFKTEPKIITDYKTAIQRLKEAAESDENGTEASSTTITAKPRLFGSGGWFTDPED